ncbi:substrate-binding periplasmic protein [Noviherbaspirillum sp.]|uniref:substrate-binding periplasmic protein n=1 Tax=Noviherbaspirillum sp. TaxID=1926288 RepID=UPI002B4A69B4|nr:transporter substrate-binding domain-containing protein [Noviherbaspirillum sp.]HJV79817.1 transporter substrate-binding domain-containing protein [Noviherbaspirillum sp.]
MSTIFRTRHLACALGALLLSGAACAAELVALTEDLPPLNYKEGGVVTGYSTELLKAMARESGFDLSVTMLPWPRAYRTTLARPDTILYSLVKTEERDPLFAWIGPISPRKIFLFRLKQRKDVHVATLADARKYRIGAVYEMAATTTLMRHGFSFRKELDGAQNDESNIKKLFAGRVDLILALDWSAYYYAKKYGRKPAELVPEILVDDSHAYYFGMRKDSDPAIVRRLSDALEKVRADGLTEKLRKKYMGK